MKNGDKSRYSELNTDLSNAFIFGKNQYPLTTEDARRILDKFQSMVPIIQKDNSNDNTNNNNQRGGRRNE